MLSELHISNYALIEHIDIEFGPGLTIITGETGAGKSIVLGALGLILGDRADGKALRNDREKTVVEAVLDITGYDLKPLFDTADIDYDENECILRREIAINGRSRAFVNDTPVTQTFLRELATRLVDIHSQHSNMLLASPEFQLSVLDSLAGNERLLKQYRDTYTDFCSIQRQLKEMTAQLEQARGEEDYLRFQLQQLQSMNLQPGEDETLEAERAKLSNAAEIKQSLWEAERLLNDEQSSAIQTLVEALSRLRSAQRLVPEYSELEQRLDSAIIDVKDIASTIGYEQGQLTLDPEQLAKVEQRLDDIYNLQRKHQVQTVDQLITVMNHYQSRLQSLDNSDDQLAQLQLRLQDTKSRALQLARQLTDNRHKAATAFRDKLLELTAKLALNNLRFEVSLTPVEMNASGTDAASFMMSFNKKQPMMPVRDTASGGEISRLMLCIKSIVAQSVNLPTIVFDEVDTGVSGDTASRMGEMMADIARNIQVIAITHLPQVAAHGNHHLKVYKTDEDGKTITRMTQLGHDEHIMEIARMLSGRDLNNAAIQNAKELVSHVQQL